MENKINNNLSSNTFIGNIIFKGKLNCETALHIGGSKDKFEIGGVDNPVIKDPFTSYPYIPGSSLKGKLRTMLEFSLGKIKKDKKGNYGPSDDEEITKLFGQSADGKPIGPTRLIVRDAYPDEETIAMWENINSETLYTEYKAENTIDRMTSAANPRFMERVFKDSKFNVEFVLQVYSMDEDNGLSNFNKLKNALKLLEDSTLGGGGSRGSGKVSFKFSNPDYRDVAFYSGVNVRSAENQSLVFNLSIDQLEFPNKKNNENANS